MELGRAGLRRRRTLPARRRPDMRLVLALLVLFPAVAAAQTQTVLFPGQSGAELLASIRAAYRPASVTGSNDDLYADVDRTTVGGQDGVVGVYTGFFVPFDCQPSCDPSQDVFNDNAGINQEHTFPRSRLSGANESAAERDLHNLFPTRIDVNAARGSLPFAEVDDAQTTRWYRDDRRTTTPPPEAERDQWSELRAGVAFEPREAHEGNAARAMFYMRAVWDDAADVAWFEAQLDDLFAWHRADRVDQAEVDRSDRAAAFQRAGGEPVPNPFVVDSTLARRAFFPGLPSPAEAGPEAPELAIRMAGPSPFRGATAIRVEAAGPVRLEVFDTLGRRVQLAEEVRPGETVAVAGDAPGVLLVRISADQRTATRRVVRLR